MTHPTQLEIQKPALLAHMWAFQLFVHNGAYDTCFELVDTIQRMSESIEEFWLGDMGTTVRQLTTDACRELLRADQLELLERVVDVLRRSVSESCWRGIHVPLSQMTDELFQDDEIDLDTYQHMDQLLDDTE